MFNLQTRRLDSTARNHSTVLTTFDLCVDCALSCKGTGPPWSKLECPSCPEAGCRYAEYRVVSMTDEELIARVAYG
jgi:hypothetical protein